jgi:hypothetical protein
MQKPHSGLEWGSSKQHFGNAASKLFDAAYANGSVQCFVFKLVFI